MTPLELEYSRRWARHYREDLPIHGPFLASMVYDAIAGHRYAEDRAMLLEAVDAGEVIVWEPDEHGWQYITVGGNPVVHAHWTQLRSRETLEALVGPLPDWQPPKAKPA